MDLEAFSAWVPTILQALLFLIMFAMGITLTVDDFKRVRKYPKAVFIGLSNQIILLPLVGFLIISLIKMPPEVAMGLILVTACPGGATSNLIAHLSKGDTALSITMTAISSLLTILTIPIIVNYALEWIMQADGVAIQLPFWPTVYGIIKLTALPVLLGMFVNFKFPKFSAASRKGIAWMSGVFILIALALMVFKLDEIGDVWTFIKQAFFPVLILNLVTLSIGYFSARLLKLNKAQAISISLESGMQNNVLGMAIAMSPSLLNNAAFATPAGVYGLVMVFTGVILIFWFRRS